MALRVAAGVARSLRIGAVSRAASQTSRAIGASASQRGPPTNPAGTRESEEGFVHDELVRDFVQPEDLYRAMRNIGVRGFFGVPDSLLKDFCAYVTENTKPENHIIAANEGAAVGMAAGHYMATKTFPVVYLQNSGLGNIVNPLMSLAHPGVYSIPMLLVVGWRGEPGKKDEPQHLIQGENTASLLTSCNIPFQVLPDFIEGAEKALQTAKRHMESTCGPYALLVRKRTFTNYSLPREESHLEMNREAAIQAVLPLMHPKDVIVSTTGMLSRELFEERVRLGQSHEKDFLTVGSMGHAPAISLGIANARSNRRVFTFDGDGAALMHLGTMASVAQHGGTNFKHVLINNGAHDSVGGQPSVAGQPTFDFCAIARGCGYKAAWSVDTSEGIKEVWDEFVTTDGPVLLEIKCRPGGQRKNLGRPTRTPLENRTDFMEFLDRV